MATKNEDPPAPAFAPVTLAKAVNHVTRAVKEDIERNYLEAFHLYELGVQYFMNSIKHEIKSENAKDKIRAKCLQYSARAEKLKAYLIETNQYTSTTAPVETISPPSPSEPSRCVICIDREINRLAAPCGHVCVCKECAAELELRAQMKCPICRTDVLVFCPMHFV